MKYLPPKLEIVHKSDLFEGSVNTWDISRQLDSEQGESFDASNFEKACMVVDVYTSDKEVLREFLR